MKFDYGTNFKFLYLDRVTPTPIHITADQGRCRFYTTFSGNSEESSRVPK